MAVIEWVGLALIVVAGGAAAGISKRATAEGVAVGAQQWASIVTPLLVGCALMIWAEHRRRDQSPPPASHS
ncbi:MAG TPA: hypothetical protein VMF30_03705 [Pirellulales bacterium]|nr:hypothetical protein [Pirellulales bacterium]